MPLLLSKLAVPPVEASKPVFLDQRLGKKARFLFCHLTIVAEILPYLLMFRLGCEQAYSFIWAAFPQRLRKELVFSSNGAIVPNYNKRHESERKQQTTGWLACHP